MSPQIKVNDVLCYLTTARNTLSRDNIILNAVGFYTNEVIYSAKEEIFSLCSERPIRRKATQEVSNPAVSNIKDILDLLDKVEGQTSLPSFVAAKFNSLPPSNFECIAAVICSLRDEVTALREEVSQMKKINLEACSSRAENECLKQDISDIKLGIKSLKERGQEDKKKSYSEATRSEQSMRRADTIISRSDAISGRVMSQQIPNKRRLNIPYDQPSTSTAATVIANPIVIDESEREHLGFVSHSQHGQECDERDQSTTEGSSRWQLVRSRRRVKPNVGVSGTRKKEEGLTGAQRVFDLFVGGCQRESNEDNIKSYCKKLGVNLKKVEKLQSKSDWYNAYKISMLENERDILMKPESWPQGIFVRKFYKAKVSRHNVSNN